MSEEPTSASGTGEMPTTPATPVKGATLSAPVATAPTQPTSPTIEELLRKHAELEHAHKNATEELERHRKNAKKLADYEKAEQEARTAALSELDKATKRATEAEQRTQQYKQQYITAQVKLAAQARGIIDPDLAALALQATLEYDDEGMPKDLDQALDKLIKHKPYLVPQPPAEPPATPAQTATVPVQQAPAIPAMSPGRSSITPPAAQTPGKPMTLNQIVWKH